jgi:glutamate transport system permease protein
MSQPTSVLYDIPGPRALRRERIGSTISGVVLAALLAVVGYKLWIEDQFDADKWEFVTNPGVWEQISLAFGRTIRAAVLAILLAVIFGLVFAAGRLSERAWLHYPSAVIVEFFRAIPLLILILFLFIAFSGQFQDFGTTLEGFMPERMASILGLGEEFAGLGPLIVGLMLYNGSVLAEVFRAGVLAVPRGQGEAAYALGMTKSTVMRQILMPQAIRIMLPAIISQCVVALKDTALGFIIAYPELVRYGRNLSQAYDNPLPTYFVIAVIYIAVNMSVSRIATWLETRQSRRYGKEAVSAAEKAIGHNAPGGGGAA